MNNPKPITNTLEMVSFVHTAYDEHRSNMEPRAAMMKATHDLFLKMLPDKAKLASTRRNAPSVFREWFTQWKAMIVRVNKHLNDPEVEIKDASFPILFWAQDPKFFIALYDAQVFLTPIPEALMEKVQAVRNEMVQEHERERQAILAKHHADFIDRAMDNYLRNLRQLIFGIK